MKTKQKLVDSIYLNSEGGKVILFQLIKYLIQNNSISNFFFLIDKRISRKDIELGSSYYQFLAPSENSRKDFYLKNKNRYNKIICLSNIPPPITLTSKVYIYFHNALLLKPLLSPLSIKDKLINILKKTYIKYLNDKSYNWIVQTDLMKKNLVSSLHILKENITVIPFFNDEISSKQNIKIKNKFVYVGSISKHKNHSRLYRAFIDAAKRINDKVELHLTIPENDFSKSVYNNYKKPKNLRIINHGIIDKKELSILYSSSEFSIFPSLIESFGLPLVESVNNNCMVIASDLEYVNEIIRPSLKFDPRSVESISYSIISAIRSSDLRESKLLVQNKIDTFVKYISRHV